VRGKNLFYKVKEEREMSVQSLNQVNPYAQQINQPAAPVNPQLNQQSQGQPSVFDLAKENKELKKENEQLMQALQQKPEGKKTDLTALAKQKAEYMQIQRELDKLQESKRIKQSYSFA
jgi:hypothetical protein